MGPALADEADPAAAPDEPALFAAAGRVIRQAEAAYLRLRGLTASAPDYRDPEAFCRDLLTVALAGPAFAAPARRDRFFAWADDTRSRSVLPAVLAALDLEGRDRAAALAYAERALGLDARDLLAQALYRRCLPAPPPAPDLRGRFCPNPFDAMETATGGRVYFCCPAWLPVPIGNLDRQDADAVWNSQAAQDIRASILDGSYRYCSRLHCPKLTAGTLSPVGAVRDREHRDIIAGRRLVMARGPQRVSLSHDRSCNLSCPSCRTGLIAARKEEQARLNAMADRVILPLLRHARKVNVTGSGDPFGSAHFRYVLKRLGQERPPRLAVDLQTNGQLFDETAWRDLGLEGLVEGVAVSIDAARRETYEVLRRGGSFDRLMANLAFVAALRRRGALRWVRLDFVVQALNFREMPAAVDLLRRFGFDRMKFQMIRSWGTYTPEEFARHNIGVPSHPQFRDFLDVLADPRLAAPGVAFWGFHAIPLPRPEASPRPADTAAEAGPP